MKAGFAPFLKPLPLFKEIVLKESRREAQPLLKTSSPSCKEYISLLWRGGLRG